MTNHKKAWSASGDLVTGNTQRAVTLQTPTFEEPDYYTLQFNLFRPANAAPTEKVAAEAEVIWTVEGNSVRRVITISSGSVISGCGNNAVVKLRDVSTNPSGINYPVSVQITKGTRPAVQQPPMLYGEYFTITPGNSVTIPIPQNAGVISAYMGIALINAGSIGPIPNDAIKALFSVGGASLTIAGFDQMMSGWVPVPPGADQLAIFWINASAQDLEGSVIWGIEG